MGQEYPAWVDRLCKIACQDRLAVNEEEYEECVDKCRRGWS